MTSLPVVLTRADLSATLLTCSVMTNDVLISTDLISTGLSYITQTDNSLIYTNLASVGILALPVLIWLLLASFASGYIITNLW